MNDDPPLANRVRERPGKASEVIGQIQPGQEVLILDGPECADNAVWWYVQELETGLTGWTAEGDRSDYWVLPCPAEKKCNLPGK